MNEVYDLDAALARLRQQECEWMSGDWVQTSEIPDTNGLFVHARVAAGTYEVTVGLVPVEWGPHVYWIPAEKVYRMQNWEDT